MTNTAAPSPFRRLVAHLGLVHRPGGEPLPGAAQKSRFGLFVSPRLDQELEELRTRMAALEELVRDQGAESPAGRD
ncbi:hypothetical protein [Kitasatospora phosalacinea]|uniref:hypothetical protein n=1 Tax=Kitasatospora phosalacinea TaxID=2065 RepID=UPI00131BCEE8|nr:hypothetical protein [Kitasatospora phosalacinea]